MHFKHGDSYSNYKINILMGSNQSKVASSGGVLSDFGEKCRPIDYSCHELLHTWSPSCSEVSFRNISGLNDEIYPKIIIDTT